MNLLRTIQLKNIRLTKGFWKSKLDMLTQNMIPYQWETLNNRTPGAPLSHAVENFRIAAGEASGQAQGTIFQDSDVAKWIEAASYSLVAKPDPELEVIIDELLRLIAKSQQADGYINTFFTASNLKKRWQDLTMGHELYCAGHLMEAAVAYYTVTGKRMFLEVMERYGDYICEVFGPEEGKIHSYDGHPEIELALYRLSEATGNMKYAKLADYFINIRGSVKDFHNGIATKDSIIPKSRWFLSDYYVAHKSVRDMDKAEGHAVRALYLYSAMADQYRLHGDETLLTALKAIWRNAISRRMYITGGMGSQSNGERFTIDYDLPLERAFAETCAAVALVFWAWRMSLIDLDGDYGDTIERVLYNGALSGVSLDGTLYFYVNPLEVVPEVAEYRQDHEHVLTRRAPWFDCACCPTNIARLIASIGNYAMSVSPGIVVIHQYISGVFKLQTEGLPVEIEEETRYPWDGSVLFTLRSENPCCFTLLLRIPAWCVKYTVKVNGKLWEGSSIEKGYISIEREWRDHDRVELNLDMSVRFIRANSKVQNMAGKVAIMRGPMVYCAEEADNGVDLHEILLDPTAQICLEQDDSFEDGMITLHSRGYRDIAWNDKDALYFPLNTEIDLAPCDIILVPYYQWGNRKPGQEMRVWLRVWCKNL